MNTILPFLRCALSCVLLAAALWQPGAVRGAIPSPLCLGRQAADFAERLKEAHARLIAVLTARIQQKTAKIINGKRFRHLPEDEREGEALSQMMGSTAYADEVARANGGVGIGEKTAQEFQFAMLNDRVLDSNKTSLTDAAAGVGLASRHPLLAKDQDLARVIRGNDTVLQSGVFQGKGYTDAEFWRDWKDIFEDNPALPIGAEFKKNLIAGQVSTRHEIRVAAYFKKQRGHELKVVAGADQGANAAKKADTLTDQAYIQAAETGKTVEGKVIDEADDLAAAIKEARESKPKRHFIIAHSDEGFSLEVEKTRNINIALAEAYGINLSDSTLDGPTQGIIDSLPERVRFPNTTSYLSYVPLE